MSQYEKKLEAKPLDLPAKETHNKNKLAFIVDEVFTEKECKDMIEMTEKQGYTLALVNIGGGRQKLMTDVRNNYRCIVDSFEKSGEIWERIKHLVPEQWRGRKALGLNERLRFLRYDPGQQFKPHFDGSYIRKNGEISCLTLQLYLNENEWPFCTGVYRHEAKPSDCVPVQNGHEFCKLLLKRSDLGFEGGSTTFLENHWGRQYGDNDVECVPKIGRVLVFQHDMLHGGSVLINGRKYCLRTDVMFSSEKL